MAYNLPLRGDVLVSISSSPAVVNFLDHDYRYKLVVTQIRRYAGIAKIHCVGDRARDGCMQD